MNEFELLKEKVNILDIFESLGGKVSGTILGDEVLVHCPFHTDKKASMSINCRKKVFFCFGCNEKGDLFDLYALMKDISKREAFLELARRYSIETTGVNIESTRASRNIKKIYYEISNIANRILMSGSNLGASYCDTRELDVSIQNKMRLGYVDGEFDLFTELKNVGYKSKDLMETGLFRKDKKFTLSNRLLIPVFNEMSEIVMFTGRDVTDTDSAKYKHSKNLLVKKSETLFNVQNHSNRSRYKYIVEGPLDVISLYKHGVKNSFAILGKDISATQYNMISRLTSNVLLWLDNDKKSVVESAYKAYKEFKMRGVNVKYIFIEEGIDPDEYCRSDIYKLSKITDHVVSFSDFFIKTVEKMIDEKSLFLEDELQDVYSEHSEFMSREARNAISNAMKEKYGVHVFLKHDYEIDQFSLAKLGFRRYDQISDYEVYRKNIGKDFIYLIKRDRIIVLNKLIDLEFENFEEINSIMTVNDNRLILNSSCYYELSKFIAAIEEGGENDFS